MELTTFNSTHEELAEAVRGAWGKDVLPGCTLVYTGQVIFGMAETTEILDKNARCSHYPWINIGTGCYLAVIK